MKVFHCQTCGQVVYFENTQCVKCGATPGETGRLTLTGSMAYICRGATACACRSRHQRRDIENFWHPDYDGVSEKPSLPVHVAAGGRDMHLDREPQEPI